MKIKFCGITRKCEIEYANILLPEYIGFVFFKKSNRYITFEKAKKLKAHLNDQIQAVGVFVDSNIDDIILAVNMGIIDIIQLHGNEDNEYIEKLRGFCDVKIIKAFPVLNLNDIGSAERSNADMVLLDSSSAGSGQCFDWSLLNSVSREYLLAGGLSEDNIKFVVEKIKPYGIDVSSGIESNSVKDYKKMLNIIKSVKQID